MLLAAKMAKWEISVVGEQLPKDVLTVTMNVGKQIGILAASLE